MRMLDSRSVPPEDMTMSALNNKRSIRYFSEILSVATHLLQHFCNTSVASNTNKRSICAGQVVAKRNRPFKKLENLNTLLLH
jgi:hypothetical protein